MCLMCLRSRCNARMIQKDTVFPPFCYLCRSGCTVKEVSRLRVFCWINSENSQENHVRDQLNRGIVPKDIDVHWLVGLIKAWFRELPQGVLDGLSPDQVLSCNSEEESMKLVKQLQPTESALLRWAIDLMADVVEEEEFNKMNARNIAMVFAPNMTQMSDPLTALMHAVQVMNFLKTLILIKLREPEQLTTGKFSPVSSPCSRQDSQRADEMHNGLKRNGGCKESESGYFCCSEHEDYTEIELISLSDVDDVFLEEADWKADNKQRSRGRTGRILFKDLPQ